MLRWSAALGCALAAAGCSDALGTPPGTGIPTSRPILDQAYRPTGRAAAGAVFVHLFEWRWRDVAAECGDVLGPAGYAAVQVSPPQEHLVLPGHPWWQRYQPVSYGLGRSRSGTRAEFSDMVQRCAAAGVGIYVDAVVNHMTAGSGVGSDGTAFTKYEYPGLYTRADFHPPCTVSDYQSTANVQDCELFGLADLDTGSGPVRGKIAGYLVELARLGVAGFRIDAAKHMAPVDVDAILTRVNQTLAAEGAPLPFIFAEVIDHGGEAVRASDYFGLGYRSGGAADITEFRFRGVAEKFLGSGGQHLAQLDPEGVAGSRFSETAWGLIPSDKAVVFLENHDTQRAGGISYRDGAIYRLASVWMLAWPYGHPKVMSSYAFDRSSPAGRDAGPPSDGAGATRTVTCATSLETAVTGTWVCEHRDPVIRAMVRFRRTVAGAPVAHWWDNGRNAIAFARGDRGFVAFNREPEPVALDVPTGLPAGQYCDLTTGGRTGSSCAGRAVAIDADGALTVTLEPNTAVVLLAAERVGGSEDP